VLELGGLLFVPQLVVGDGRHVSTLLLRLLTHPRACAQRLQRCHVELVLPLVICLRVVQELKRHGRVEELLSKGVVVWEGVLLKRDLLLVLRVSVQNGFLLRLHLGLQSLHIDH